VKKKWDGNRPIEMTTGLCLVVDISVMAVVAVNIVAVVVVVGITVVWW
jgi:hypothetical protein